MKNKLLLSGGIFVASLMAALHLIAQDLPYQKDTDHDGFPDDLEMKTGFDPGKNEALVRSSQGGKCGAIKTDFLKLGKPHNILLILDGSGSMSTALDSSTRMEVAKKILSKYIDSLPQFMKIGFVLYGKSGCEENSIELINSIGNVNRSELKDKISSIKPRGQTPIALTLNKSYEYFKGIEEENNYLILISDGMESCGGNPVKTIRDLKESSIDPEVRVIGLGVDNNTRRQLSQIASSSGGEYSDVMSEKDLVKAFSDFFSRLDKFYKDIVCIISQYNTYLTFETQQYNKSKAFLLREKLKASGDLKITLETLEKKLDANHNDRIKIRDLLQNMVNNKITEMTETQEKFKQTGR